MLLFTCNMEQVRKSAINRKFKKNNLGNKKKVDVLDLFVCYVECCLSAWWQYKEYSVTLLCCFAVGLVVACGAFEFVVCALYLA